MLYRRRYRFHKGGRTAFASRIDRKKKEKWREKEGVVPEKQIAERTAQRLT